MVTLTKARAALGPFYFNVAPPPQQGFRDGTVIMEVTAQAVVDVLDPTPRSIPIDAKTSTGADGETGTAVSVEIDLFPPDDTQCDCNATLLSNYSGEAGQAYVAGTATMGPSSVPFAGWITIDQSLATPNDQLPYLQRIAGASVNLSFTSNQQSLALQVDPTHWFDQADFSVFPPIPSSADAGTLDANKYSLINGAYTWTNHSTFHNQLLQGFWATTGVYDFTLTGP
jgi:hypothetical protein